MKIRAYLCLLHYSTLRQSRRQIITQAQTRPIYEISKEIRKDWTKPYFGAQPYLNVMHELTNITDKYWEETGKTVIVYFLSNASTWRGPVAKRVKIELREMIK